jgi:hypothetical protein
MSEWPALPLAEWRYTCATLHLWLQIVGKVRLVQTPPVNHGWNATFYVTARGLTTSAMPHGTRAFEVAFDFIAHEVVITASDGSTGRLPLQPQSVAVFHRSLLEELHTLGLDVQIYGRPNEIADPIPFAEDETHRAYDPEYAARFWRVLVQCDRVFEQFRSRFVGKCSPVHLFWGAADLAVTRFSGRRAPPHPGGVPHLPDRVVRDA